MTRASLLVLVCFWSGCSIFAATPALPGESEKADGSPSPANASSEADAESRVANATEPTHGSQAPERASQEPPKKKRRKRKRRSLSEGWHVGVGYTTSAKPGILIDHLGIPHTEALVPIGTESVLPTQVSSDTRQLSTSFVDGSSTDWSLGAGVTSEVVNGRIGYLSREDEISVGYTMQRKCVSVVHSGTLRKNVRVPRDAKYVPYEVCIGHGIIYTLKLTESSLSGEVGGEVNLADAIGSGLASKILAKLAGDLLTFKGTIGGFINKHNVDIKVSTVGFGDSGSKCTARDLTSSKALECMTASADTDSPVLVRWRTLDYDPSLIEDRAPERGTCTEYRLSSYRYTPSKRTSGKFLVSIYPNEARSKPMRGKQGEMFGVTARAGERVSYAVRRSVDGMERPEVLEDGTLSMPNDPRDVVVSSHSGRLKVTVECIRRGAAQ